MVKRAAIRTVHSPQLCLRWVSQFTPSGLARCKGLGCPQLRHCHTWVLAARAQGSVRQALHVCSGSIQHPGGRSTKSRSVTELWPYMDGSCRMRSPFTRSQDWHGTVWVFSQITKDAARECSSFSACFPFPHTVVSIEPWNGRCELNSLLSPSRFQSLISR